MQLKKSARDIAVIVTGLEKKYLGIPEIWIASATISISGALYADTVGAIDGGPLCFDRRSRTTRLGTCETATCRISGLPLKGSTPKGNFVNFFETEKDNESLC